MPEGPEAHTIARKLNEVITGKYIVGYSVISKGEILSLDGLTFPNKIKSVSAHGKRPIFTLETGYIVTFLAMNGRWSFTPDASSTFQLILSDNANVRESTFIIEDDYTSIYYSGRGKSGHVKYLNDDRSLLEYFKNFGPDMLVSSITEQEYIDRAKLTVPSNMIVAEFLLEQKYFSGVGNYLRCDIMYLCRLKPNRQMGSLSDIDFSNLYRYTKERMGISYNNGGLTMRDYWDPYGAKGVYPKIIYMEKMDTFGNKVENEVIGKDRRVYWVPSIQF